MGVSGRSSRAQILQKQHFDCLLHALWRNIASPNVALWTHVVRRRERAIRPPQEVRGFADALGTKYARRLAGETLMVNELFIAIVYRPAAGVTTGTVSRLLSNVQKTGSRLELAEALDSCEKLAQSLRASLWRDTSLRPLAAIAWETCGARRYWNSWACSSTANGGAYLCRAVR
jgi:type IV secretory pathway VirB4 component